MAVKDRVTLKSYFETGDKPTEAQFIDLIDSIFNISDDNPLQGTPGINGKTVMLRKDTGYLQWKYPDDETWANIVALSEITGPQGIAGERGLAGREIELQKGSTHIQYRYVGETGWIDLISIADITGPAGSYSASQIRDMLHSLGLPDMLSSDKVQYNDDTTVKAKLQALDLAIAAKANELKTMRMIFDGQVGTAVLTIQGVQMRIIQLNINRVMPLVGVLGSSYGFYDFKYQYSGGNTLINFSPSLNQSLVLNDIIDIIYTEIL